MEEQPRVGERHRLERLSGLLRQDGGTERKCDLELLETDREGRDGAREERFCHCRRSSDESSELVVPRAVTRRLGAERLGQALRQAEKQRLALHPSVELDVLREAAQVEDRECRRG